jgi:uncharacterized membrane protein YfcA
MTYYLPIAGMSVNIALYLAMGGAVGFISGMFGVGGGFLMTPLLIFTGIPSAVAVGTESAQIVASSVSGAMSHYRRGTVDLKLALVLVAGGIVGGAIGVEMVKLLRRIGQFDLFISLCYAVLLGLVGMLMLAESWKAILARKKGRVLSSRRSGQHSWIHGLPFKLRFKRARLYISAVAPLAIGAFVGLLAAIMGVGGGFILIPALIYLLRVPTSIVIGTSLFPVVLVAAVITVMHASQNQTVDFMLAGLLVVGSVIGAQFGAVAGERLRADELRFLLAVLVLAVGVRMAWSLFSAPVDLYSIAAVRGG